MSTQLKIANRALFLLGEKKITSLSQSQLRAEAIEEVFGDVMRSVLRRHPWNCAMESETLVLVSPSPSFGWEYAFTLPSDFIRLTKLNGNEIQDGLGANYEIRKGQLLTDEATADIVFVAEPTLLSSGTTEFDVSEFDSLLVEALATKLAAVIAPTIREDGRSMALNLEQQYETVILAKARLVDTRQRKKRKRVPGEDSNWIRARYGSTRG